MKYEITKLPKINPVTNPGPGEGITHHVEVKDLKEARKWIRENGDTSHQWIIINEENQRFSGIEIKLWSVYNHTGKAKSKIFYRVAFRQIWFDTKEEAENDYKLYMKKANKLLDKAEKDNKEQENLHEEHLEQMKYQICFSTEYPGNREHINIETNGYEYRRYLD